MEYKKVDAMDLTVPHHCTFWDFKLLNLFGVLVTLPDFLLHLYRDLVIADPKEKEKHFRQALFPLER